VSQIGWRHARRHPPGGIVSAFLDRLLSLHGAVLYLVVGGLVLAEDAVFVGFVVPGETAAILGGVAASRHNASVVVLCVVVVVAAVVGDSVGYAIGARYGDRLLRSRGLLRRAARLDRARELLNRRGGPAVFAGRFVAFLRAVMPALAGSAHLRYPRFFAYNFAGGLVWGVASVLVGYLAGNSYKAVAKAFGSVTAAIVALAVIAALIVWAVRRHRREGRADSPGDPDGPAAAPGR
jgi:membrane-associated protein